MSVDNRLEHIFEAWFDYEHSTDEDAKLHHRNRRAALIVAAMKEARVTATTGDFLHHYRDRYQEWAIRKNLRSGKKRF